MNHNGNAIESRLWAAADELRANSKLKSSEYSVPVLGLVFLRYADHKFQEAAKELTSAGGGGRRKIGPADYQARGVLYLPEAARFSALIALPEGDNIGAAINEAMRTIEAENPDLKDVLPKTYNRFENALLNSLLKAMNSVPMDIEGDAFGKIYEYFLGHFAMSEGQKGGEFFTPTAIVQLIVGIIEPFQGRIFDPACGSGGMFVQSARFVAEHKKNPGAELSIYGQEKVAETVRLGKMNLAVHSLAGDIRQGNAYYEDLHRSPGKFDFVMANPPFNVDRVDKDRLKDDPRFPFGLPRTDNANYLWIQLFYSALSETGRAGFIMANSASDARASELEIRRQLIEARAVDVMVAVGSNFFYTVTLPCTLWFFDRGKGKTARADQVLFIDDLVTHFTGRGFQGKAMMICIDKTTAVRMYDKVKKYWSEKIAALQAEAAGAEGEARREIEAQITRMKETDMAVVVSQGQNEIAEMSEKGLDIRPHRKRMVDEDLETKFKNPDDPFRLVFVCAMWMTGFDVPSCSTLYLDKPMRNHTLMQTIARANRVYPGKVSGLIVDYAGMFRNLERALAIYGAGGAAGGNKPVEDKSALVAALRQALAETRGLCQEHGVNLAAIQAAEGFARVSLLDDAVEALVASEEIKLRYLDLTNTALRLYKAVLPDPAAKEFAAEVLPLQVIADKIRALTRPADISQVMQQVEGLLDQSIATEGYVIREPSSPFDADHWLDLSKIDFEKLAEKFKTGRRRTLNEKLKGTVAQKLMVLVRQNRTRMDYLEQFQAMIDAYNAGSLNTEELFQQLVAFAQSLNEEEQRGVGEQLSEEELALFDLLTKPQIDMSDTDREKVKATARDLLATLKAGKLVLDWRKRQQARAEVRVTIEKLLDKGLPRAYTPELFEQKTTAVFQHVYDAYYGAGRSIYAAA